MTGTSKPVKGHALRRTLGLSVCECGAESDYRIVWSESETWNENRVRAWHREHKAAVLAAREETKA